MNKEKYSCGMFVLVANASTMGRQQDTRSEAVGMTRKRSEDGWVARILEIRAVNCNQVYARVCWMYWPDDVPEGTTVGKKRVRGRQSYHGHNELIAWNHSKGIRIVPGCRD